MLIRGITIAGYWPPYLLSCNAALFWLRVKFDIFLSWECYYSRHPIYVSDLKHNCNVMRGEAEMGLDMYEGRIGPLGYVFTWKRRWGWNFQVGERKGCRGEDIWMLTVREDGGCWMRGGVERYDPLWRLLTGSAEGRRKSFRLSVIYIYIYMQCL